MNLSGKIGYRRVSSADQKLDRQLEGLGITIFYDDIASGKDTNRPKLNEMIDNLRPGEHIYIHSMDRLARNLKDLIMLLEKILLKNVTIHFVTEGRQYSNASDDPMDMLMLQMIGIFAEFERKMIKKRQEEGIALAKKRGAYTGRLSAMTQEELDYIYHLKDLGVSDSKIAKRMGMSRSKIFNYTSSKSRLKCVKTGGHNLNLKFYDKEDRVNA